MIEAISDELNLTGAYMDDFMIFVVVLVGLAEFTLIDEVYQSFMNVCVVVAVGLAGFTLDAIVTDSDCFVTGQGARWHVL